MATATDHTKHAHSRRKLLSKPASELTHGEVRTLHGHMVRRHAADTATLGEALPAEDDPLEALGPPPASWPGDGSQAP
ncbi:MAG TPA: hypothetical protein VE338_06850 [Ktedonobacterales bacterium]|jgi:hypothetical protein|nr:hypothetical protein [Ktedonobacterales bacterium]